VTQADLQAGCRRFPLLRAGLALSAVVPIALATDTVSIAIMEIVDTAVLILEALG
jgi:hypothetical protein